MPRSSRTAVASATPRRRRRRPGKSIAAARPATIDCSHGAEAYGASPAGTDTPEQTTRPLGSTNSSASMPAPRPPMGGSATSQAPRCSAATGARRACSSSASCAAVSSCPISMATMRASCSAPAAAVASSRCAAE
jgi:hypothetical protein